MPQFFIRDGMYFETTTPIETWSDNRVPVPQRPAPHWDWIGGEWVEGTPIIYDADVNRERDRRIEEGTVITVDGYGDVALSGREKDTVNLQGLAFGARLMLDQGDTTTITPFRDRDDVVHQLTPMQILEVWQKGSAYVSRMYQVAWAMKDGGIPVDYAEDHHWA